MMKNCILLSFGFLTLFSVVVSETGFNPNDEKDSITFGKLSLLDDHNNNFGEENDNGRSLSNPILAKTSQVGLTTDYECERMAGDKTALARRKMYSSDKLGITFAHQCVTIIQASQPVQKAAMEEAYKILNTVSQLLNEAEGLNEAANWSFAKIILRAQIKGRQRSVIALRAIIPSVPTLSSLPRMLWPMLGSNGVTRNPGGGLINPSENQNQESTNETSSAIDLLLKYQMEVKNGIDEHEKTFPSSNKNLSLCGTVASNPSPPSLSSPSQPSSPSTLRQPLRHFRPTSTTLPYIPPDKAIGGGKIGKLAIGGNEEGKNARDDEDDDGNNNGSREDLKA